MLVSQYGKPKGGRKGLYLEGLITGIIFSLADRWAYNQGEAYNRRGPAYKRQLTVLQLAFSKLA